MSLVYAAIYSVAGVRNASNTNASNTKCQTQTGTASAAVLRMAVHIYVQQNLPCCMDCIFTLPHANDVQADVTVATSSTRAHAHKCADTTVTTQNNAARTAAAATTDWRQKCVYVLSTCTAGTLSTRQHVLHHPSKQALQHTTGHTTRPPLSNNASIVNQSTQQGSGAVLCKQFLNHRNKQPRRPRCGPKKTKRKTAHIDATS